MRQLGINLTDQAVLYAFGMSKQTVDEESKKLTVYDRLIFVEFIEFLCRILYSKFSADLDANLLKDQNLNGQALDLTEALEVPSSHLNSQATTSRKISKPQDEEQKKAAHDKHIWAYKEFCCSHLDTFFE